MRILAASFDDHATAMAAMARLDTELDLGGGTIRVASLGRASEPWGPSAVLAGRFKDDTVVPVRTVVAEFGGTVVIDVDSSATNG
jgi:hypothetical protein